MRTRKEIDDSLLESGGQQQVRELVSSLPEDTLSLAWRSQLNEKLLQNAQKSRRRQMMVWFMKPALGLALTGALAAVVMIRVSGFEAPTHKPVGTLEAALVQEHQQNVAVSDVVGFGINPMESRTTDAVAGDDWSEVDFESL